MTDFRFDLKAIRVKRVLAMFMAVCLTVLSVNVEAFATTPDKIVVPSVKTIGYKGGAGDLEFKVTKLDGELLSPYSGELKVEFTTSDSKIIDFGKNDKVTVSVLNGQIDTKIKVAFAENTKSEERTDYVGLTFKDAVTGEVVSFTKGKPVVLEVTQDAAPFVPGKTATELQGENNKDFVSYPNGDQNDKASKYNGKTVSAYDANLVSQNYVNGIDTVVKTDVVKVTFYNGIAVKNASYGTAVAFATRTKGADMNVRAKADTLKAFEASYKLGKEFTGYDVYAVATVRGKMVLSGAAVQTNVAYEAIKCNDNYAAVAHYVAKDAENANLTASMNVAVKQTATLQVAANDYTLVKGTDKSVKYETVIQSVKAGKDIKLSKTNTIVAGTEIVANKAAAKHVINTVKYDAKAAVFTVKAGDTVTSTPAQVVINRVVTKVAKDSNNKNIVVKTPVATLEVTVADKVAAPTSITLLGLYGETYANVDYTTDKNQKIKVVATVDGSTALTKDVKFMAVDTRITQFTYTKAESAKLKTAMKASKTVKVDKNGNITVKGITKNAEVYAYTQTKNKADGMVTLVLSNPFTVTASKSTAAFSVVKDQKFKYNNAIAKKGTTPKVDANAYVPKRAQAVKYTVKGIAKDATDYVAVKVLDKNGNVILGGVTRVQKYNSKTKTYSDKNAFEYQVNLEKGIKYSSDDNLVIVGTAQNGLQKVAKLTFAAK